MLSVLMVLACGGDPQPVSKPVPEPVVAPAEIGVPEVTAVYQEWLRGRWHDPDEVEGSDFVVEAIEVPLIDETWYHAGGSWEGGHEFFPATWAHVEKGRVHFVDQDSSVAHPSRHQKFARNLAGVYLCTPDGRRLVVREGNPDSFCLNRLTSVQQRFLAGIDEDTAEEQVSALAGWLLRFAYGGRHAEVLKPDYTPPGESRWWHGEGQPEIRTPSVEVEAGDAASPRVTYKAVFRVSTGEPGRTVVDVTLFDGPKDGFSMHWTELGEEIVAIE